MNKFFNSKSLILAVLCSAGSLFAGAYKIDNLEGIQTDYLGPLKQQWVTTNLKGIDEEGYLHGSTVLYNNTHFPYNIATNLYIVDEDSPEKPILIHNVKKDDAIDGIEKLSNLTWKSSQVKHVRDPKAKRWQFWKRIKKAGVKTLNWKVKVNDIVSDEKDDGFYIEVKNEQASGIVLSIANTYIELGEKTVNIADLMINGASTNDINTSIDGMVDFAAGSFYVKHITKENAPACKSVLKDAAYLMIKDILPVIKDNKNEVENFVTVAIQIITGNVDIAKADQAIDSLRNIVLSKSNSALSKDIFLKLSNILEQLNTLNIFKNEAAVNSYVVFLSKTANGITDDKLMSQHNTIAVFDGLKIAVRIASDQMNLNEIIILTENWYNNGLYFVIQNSNLSNDQIKASDIIFQNMLNIATKENGKYFDESVDMVQEIVNIIQNKEEVDKILEFIITHKGFFAANKTELVVCLRASGEFVPAQKNMIESIILIIENLQNFI